MTTTRYLQLQKIHFSFLYFAVVRKRHTISFGGTTCRSQGSKRKSLKVVYMVSFLHITKPKIPSNKIPCNEGSFDCMVLSTVLNLRRGLPAPSEHRIERRL